MARARDRRPARRIDGYRDKSFKTDEEIMRVLSLPVLAVVPVMLTQRSSVGRGAGDCSSDSATERRGACFAVVAYTFVY
jgi:hypothetical protein